MHEAVRWFETPTFVDMVVGELPARPLRPPAPMAITTIVARNYLPRARLLARSFLAHHPNGRMTVLVTDADGSERSDGLFEVLTLDHLPLSRRDVNRMAFMYDVTELATAVKPLLLQFLLFERGEPAVTYLDPDIELFAPIDDLDRRAREHGIVLTPHRLVPVPDDGCQPDARMLSLSGAFNLGFIAVGPSSREFLERWAVHCRTNCIVAHDEGFFVDQRWVDAGVVSFRHHIIDDPGCNVAYWNLDARPITDGPDGLRAGGWPLRFFHYSGFDDRLPHLLSKHQGVRPRNLLSTQPALTALLEGYAARLRAEAVDDEPALPYRWDATWAGLPIDTVMRRLYREEILRRERDTTGSAPPIDELPDFFDQADDDELLAFLAAPLPGSELPRVGRYLHLVYLSRRDVRDAYPDLNSTVGLDGFHTWLRNTGHLEESIPAELIPSAVVTTPEPPPPLRRGVNIIGYFTAELGVGEGGRGMLATLGELGEPCAVVNETSTSNRQRHHVDRSWSDWTDHDVNIICVNSDQMPRIADRLGDRLRPDQYTVGMWAWELEVFPPEMQVGVPYVDEVWINSHHAAAAVLRAVPELPVYVVLPPVQQYPTAPPGPHPLGIDADFSFLFCFDVNSSIERKNPEGVVRAFRAAFPPGSGPTLIIKSHNGRFDQLELERLRYEARDRKDIHIIDAVLDVGELRRLDRHVRLLRLAAPRRGVRLHDGRGDARRRAGDRHPLLRQPRVHGRRQQLPRRCRSRRGGSDVGSLSSRGGVGRPRSRRRSAPDAPGVRRRRPPQGRRRARPSRHRAAAQPARTSAAGGRPAGRDPSADRHRGGRRSGLADHRGRPHGVARHPPAGPAGAPAVSHRQLTRSASSARRRTCSRTAVACPRPRARSSSTSLDVVWRLRTAWAMADDCVTAKRASSRTAPSTSRRGRGPSIAASRALVRPCATPRRTIQPRPSLSATTSCTTSAAGS